MAHYLVRVSMLDSGVGLGLTGVWTSGASHLGGRGTWGQSVYYTLMAGVGEPLLVSSDLLPSEATLAAAFLFQVQDAAASGSAECAHRLAGTHGSHAGWVKASTGRETTFCNKITNYFNYQEVKLNALWDFSSLWGKKKRFLLRLFNASSCNCWNFI